MKSNSESKPKTDPKGNPLTKLLVIGGVIVAAEVLLGFLFLGVFARKNRTIFSDIVKRNQVRKVDRPISLKGVLNADNSAAASADANSGFL